MKELPQELSTQQQEPLKSKIGIVSYVQTNNSLGVSYAYYHWAAQFGDVVFVNPLTKTLDPSIDLLILPGGPDVDPSRYLSADVPVSLFTQRPDPVREWFDLHVLPLYIENRTPIFGICRGHQTLAVHFGGTLLQHMWHETSKHDQRDELVHYIHFKYLNNRGSFKSNSLHHQVVSYIDPTIAEVIGWYGGNKKEFKLRENRIDTIEALWYINYPIASVQWHPEEIWDAFSIRLVDELLEQSYLREKY